MGRALRHGLRSQRWAPRPLALAAVILAASGCATPDAPGDAPGADHYQPYVWIEAPIHERVVVRWHERQMPLKVHLPAPPAEIASDPQAVLDVVRDGILDWTDVAGPGLPSIVFVGSPGEADIPIVWEREPSGDWYGAHCAYDIDALERRFGVARILVTTHAKGGPGLPLGKLYVLMLHEMGHAIGLTGHSPDPRDVMYHGRLEASGLSERDRETLRRIYMRPVGSRVVGARTAEP